MKTHEEGYALGWADAIYAYESKQRKQMSTVGELMALVDSYRCARGTRWAIRDAIEAALRASEQAGYERGRSEPAQAAEPPMPMGWLESPHGAFRANPLVRVSMPPETLAWQIPLYFSPPKREPLAGCSDLRDACAAAGPVATKPSGLASDMRTAGSGRRFSASMPST